MSKFVPLLLAAPLLFACAHGQGDEAETLSWVVAAEATERTETLTAADVVMLRSVSDVELSPDGKWVAYALRVPQPLDEPGGSNSQIWIVDASGKNEPRQLTSKDNSSWSPRWMSDGRLSFVSRRGGGKSQLYAIAVDGGEAELVFEAKSSISSYQWSPDGKQVAYTSYRQTDEAKAEADAGRDWVVDEAGGTKARLFAYTLADEAEHEVVSSGEHIIGFEWSPDGSRLAVRASQSAAVDHVYMYSALYTVAASGGKLESLTKTAGKLGSMVWSPKGDQIAFLGAKSINDSTAGIVYVVPSGGGEAKALTAGLEATGARLDWSADETIVMLANQGTKTVFHKISPAGGNPTPALAKGPICHDVSFGDKGALACAGGAANHPPEVFSGKLGRGLSRVTVSNPALLDRVLGEQSVVSWKAKDGLELEGVLIKPVGYEKGKRYPLAVLPHGGPEGVSQDGWNTRPTYPAQIFASRGYVAFMPNYRGSAGRGADFAMADHEDLGGAEFEDVLAGIDHLVAEGLVDGDRVGMGGWSYGGYFSALAATTYSERFDAAMCAAGITNWISFTGTTEIEHENSLVHWKLWPWDDMELPWERSPLAHIQGSKTATLVVHGMADTRVPVGQSTELYRGLKHLGVPTQLVMYPREGHGIRENVHGLDFIERFVGWFDEHVQ